MTHSITCPRCHRDFDALPAHGALHRHRDDGSRTCKGSPVLSISLPWTDALTQNQLRRMHHHAEAKAKRLLSDPARWMIRNAHLARIEHPVEVTLHWRMPDRRGRDADGIAPTLKVALDCLVREGVLADDNWHWVPRSGTHLHPPKPGMPSGMWVEISSMEEE